MHDRTARIVLIPILLLPVASCAREESRAAAPDAPPVVVLDAAPTHGSAAQPPNQPAAPKAVGFENLARAENVCVAAFERASAMLSRSRPPSDARRTMTPQDLLVVQREARARGDLETYAGCLASDSALDIDWAVGQLLGVGLMENVRAAQVSFDRRFPEATAVGSPAARVMAALREMLHESESTPPDSRVVSRQGVLRIVDARGDLGFAIVQRRGVWFAADPVQRVDVVRDGLRALLRGMGETALFRAAVDEARDLPDLEARLVPISNRVAADLAAYELHTASGASTR